MATEALFIRLYLDENIFPDLAQAIRERGFDCQNAAEAGMLSNSDDDQLQYAASRERCILTFKVKHFVPLGLQWSQAGRQHAGIVVTEPVGRRRFGELLRRTLRLLNTTTADEMRNQIRHLSSAATDES